MVRHNWPAAAALEPAAKPGTEDDCTRKGDKTADRVNNRGTGEVVEAGPDPRQEVARAAHGRQESVRTPSPVTNNRIDETGDGNAIEQIANERRTADHRTRRD